MRRCTEAGIGLLAATLLVAGCGGGTEAATTTAAATTAATTATTAQSGATTTTASGPAASVTTATTTSSVLPPTVEIAWFGVSPDKEFPVFRFLAYVTNPNAFPLEGVEVHWEVLDEDGVIVGDFPHRFPVIDAGFGFVYVGGAGDANLSGVPASVEIFLDDAGGPAEGAPSPVLIVSDVILGPPDSYDGSYSPSAVVDAPDHAVLGSQIAVAWVYFDASGGVVGAEFGTWTDPPQQIRPGTRFRVEDRVLVDPEMSLLSGEPTSVEVFVYEDV